ncbi:serine/threonine-protein kinase [Kitasatospora sp. NPDC056184]|uniref:serine/threonine-protein kinase n=1 Tax=Kitasatospora sp. NPDC056184 TaxID=3345738 RepID=UPI0035DEEEBC
MARRVRKFGNIEDHYELVEHIGEGAQGDLYLGQSLKTEERVAIKLQRQRDFQSERSFAELAREITGEGVFSHLITGDSGGTLQLFGIGDYQDRRCIVLEYVDGVVLYDLMTTSRPIKDVATVASIIGQLCEILDDVHRRNFVHRDLKPENVMVEHSGRVRLIDLGLTVRAHRRTRAGCGTIGYAPLEQLNANPDGVTAQADIFALGCLLLEMTVMELPYAGSRAGLTAEYPVVLPEERLSLVPTPFATLALSMVELAAEKRPTSVREVFEHLRPNLPAADGPRPVKPLRPDPTEYYRTTPPRW